MTKMAHAQSSLVCAYWVQWWVRATIWNKCLKLLTDSINFVLKGVISSSTTRWHLGTFYGSLQFVSLEELHLQICFQKLKQCQSVLNFIAVAAYHLSAISE